MDERHWFGGIVSLPGYVTGEGEPYRPELLIWASLDGSIHGFEVFKPGEALAAGPFHLKRVIGKGTTPKTVRVASPELASALEAAFRDIAVTCAPTPEIDELVASLADFQSKRPSAPPSYLDCGVSAEAAASFFRAAKRFYESKAWSAWDGPCLVDVPELGVKDAAVSLMGDLGQHFGFVMFSSLDDLDRFASAGIDLEMGSEPRDLPPHISLEFERRKAMPPSMVAEIKHHGWKLASASAYPHVGVTDEDLVSRGPAPKELAVVEAICLALAIAVEESEPEASVELRVDTSAGRATVTLRWPEGELVPEPTATTKAFLETQDTHWLGMVANYASDFFDTTPEELASDELDEMLFDVFPRKVTCDSSDARAIVEELRALYRFVGRGDLVLRLDDGVIDDLEDALADPARWGPAKSVMMSAKEQGFDIHTEKGLRAFMDHVNARPLGKKRKALKARR